MNSSYSGSPRWSVEAFERFWSSPERDLTRVPAVLTEDVIGFWPGRNDPVRGRREYMRCISQLVEALPDVRLRVVEHAASGDSVFVHWIMYGAGRRGPFEMTGIDRIRVRNGLLYENLVVFDTAAFEARAGMSVPWASGSA